MLRLRNLVAVVMLSGIYSLLCAALYTMLDAVDVAFTEAAVGAGISTVLLLATLAFVGREEKRPTRRPLLPLFVVLVTGGVLVYGTSDMPPVGDPANPANLHVAPAYIEGSEEIGIPNIVTTVLASYRGYDTMGETTVIFTAVVGVLLLLATGPRPRRRARVEAPPKSAEGADHGEVDAGAEVEVPAGAGSGVGVGGGAGGPAGEGQGNAAGSGSGG